MWGFVFYDERSRKVEKALQVNFEMYQAEVERVQKYSTQVKVPLHY